MPKIDLDSIEAVVSTTYPAPFAADMAKRHSRRLGPIFNLKDFGVTHVVLEPGGMSSHRHWHEQEDEFVVVTDGEAVLVEDEGETILRAGDCAVFPKGLPNAHHFINRSERECALVAFGRAPNGNCHYPDVDLFFSAAERRFTRKDGSNFE